MSMRTSYDKKSSKTASILETSPHNFQIIRLGSLPIKKAMLNFNQWSMLNNAKSLFQSLLMGKEQLNGVHQKISVQRWRTRCWSYPKFLLVLAPHDVRHFIVLSNQDNKSRSFTKCGKSEVQYQIWWFLNKL